MAKTSSRTIAVVDDDAAVLDSFRFVLELSGYEVATYPSAIDFLENNGAQAHCLILDQHMPTMTGLELAARLRADGIDIPIMLVTAAPSPAIAARAAELGIEKVFEKPPSEDDLLHFITSCG